MSLVKSQGNMYDWVTHMHTHLGGECSHKCSYCYVQRGRAQVSGKYKGPIRLIEKELQVNYGEGKTIFIEHMNDMFAKDIPGEWIERILAHCFQYSKNKYVFQSKNPERASGFAFVALDYIFGTTIESNRLYGDISKAPPPILRYEGMMNISAKKFITIEPIMDFDVNVLAGWIKNIKPGFVNIGADSKHSGLPEPSKEKILELVAAIREAGIEIRKKVNLERILEKP